MSHRGPGKYACVFYAKSTFFEVGENPSRFVQKVEHLKLTLIRQFGFGSGESRSE